MGGIPAYLLTLYPSPLIEGFAVVQPGVLQPLCRLAGGQAVVVDLVRDEGAVVEAAKSQSRMILEVWIRVPVESGHNLIVLDGKDVDRGVVSVGEPF